MIKHQEYFSRKFYQDLKTGYWISTDYPRIRAHRWVWNNIHGPIPKGYHVHHKDENKSNNDIINLELIEGSRHYRHHMTEEKKARAREMADKYRPLTKAWHGSEEGKLWHKVHGITTWKKRKPKKYICLFCGSGFESLKFARTNFCSNKCKSARRRESGIDNVQAVCVLCASVFISNKYKHQIYCSRKCSDNRKRD